MFKCTTTSKYCCVSGTTTVNSNTFRKVFSCIRKKSSFFAFFFSYYVYAFDPFEWNMCLKVSWILHRVSNTKNGFVMQLPLSSCKRNVLFYVLLLAFWCSLHNERQGPKSYTICTALPLLYQRKWNQRLGSIGIYYVDLSLYALLLLQNAIKKDITTCPIHSWTNHYISHLFFLSLFSFSFFWVTTAHRGCKCRWKSTLQNH